VRPGGFLFAFSNTRDVAREEWVKSVEERLEVKKGGEWRRVDVLEQDVDFRYKEGDLYGKYLKGLVLKRASVKNKES
jgi:hypothetical protein